MLLGAPARQGERRRSWGVSRPHTRNAIARPRAKAGISADKSDRTDDVICLL